MSSVLDLPRKPIAAVEQRQRNRITTTQKNWLLSVHLLFMAVWFGGFIFSLALNVIALSATDPHLLNAVYAFGDILDTFVIRGGAAGSLITGLLLAFLTQWGLLRFYWIIAKESAAFVIVLTDQFIIRLNHSALDLTAAQGLAAITSPDYLSLRTQLFIGLGLRVVLLLGVIVISVFKPWGQRKRAGKTPGQVAAAR